MQLTPEQLDMLNQYIGRRMLVEGVLLNGSEEPYALDILLEGVAPDSVSEGYMALEGI